MPSQQVQKQISESEIGSGTNILKTYVHYVDEELVILQ
jgi:hypothetical protein